MTAHGTSHSTIRHPPSAIHHPTSDIHVVRIVHITPHLPPDQAANALLPFHLGEWARARGDSVQFIAHPPALRSAEGQAGGTSPDVAWIPRTRRSLAQRLLRTGSVAGAWR